MNELRYAGRRLIDAWVAISQNDQAGAASKINDAKFDCHRARHDSIDAITNKIALDTEITVQTFTLTTVVAVFQKYSEMLACLLDIEKRIEESRADRENRQAVYSTYLLNPARGFGARIAC